jgi:NAD(P)-dependent dehydrogenase (short-subunit alcohol dehydrogenase family)
MAGGGKHTAQIHATNPMQRMGRAEGIAAMILFLASDGTSYITGAEFFADGGHTAQ